MARRRRKKYDPYEDPQAAGAFSNRERTLDALVADLVADPYVKKGLARADLLDAIPRVLSEILGAGAAQNCRALALRADVLIVETTDSIWAQKVSMAAERLLARLRGEGLELTATRIEVRTRGG
jgi:hypothetical protein